VLGLVEQLRVDGIDIEHLDLGGGLGIRYREETPPLPADHAAALLSKLAGLPYEISIEPGRAIVGNAGILVTRVELLKLNEHKNFAVVDAAMNDLLRPALYSAWQEIIPVQQRDTGETRDYDVVGPVCETGDFLGKDRELTIAADDLLAVRSAGAYGFAMSSNYNSRPRAAEVMVDGDQMFLVRERETIEDLFAGESLLPPE
jgi:diaminopimelate decarboxylase